MVMDLNFQLDPSVTGIEQGKNLSATITPGPWTLSTDVLLQKYQVRGDGHFLFKALWPLNRVESKNENLFLGLH